MLKAVIFDDEYIVLQGLQTMIDWKQYGIELAGTAANGTDALALFEATRPDIVFTDIRMPGMDGLEVIENILSMAPDTICIVFSGFNEFEYVKKALKLGVVDYLEKPITIPMIEEAIKRTIEKIEHRQNVSMIQSKWNDMRAELLEKATFDLLMLGKEAIPKWRESFGEEAERIKGVTVLATFHEGWSLPEDDSYKAVHIRNGKERLFIVFHLTHLNGELWEKWIMDFEDEKLVIGAGTTYEYVEDAPKSYQEALQALRYGQFMQENGLIRFEDVGKNPNIPMNLPEQEENMIFCMRSGDQEGLREQMQRFLKQLDQQRLNPDILEQELLKMIYLALEVVKEVHKDMIAINDPHYLPHIHIRAIRTKEDLYRWFQEQMEKMMERLLAARREIKHEAVAKACDYIEKYYFRDLTLQEVAEYVGMNPAYFSLLFKEEMGQSYIKYLTNVRMEQAKKLLREGEKVSEVSQKVGYHSYRHFSELFKKYTGMKPGQYRDIFDQ
ncbi:response regulator [Geobacillus thermoleovorans]|nr:MULTISPECIES: response regulator [Geobacillus]MCG6794021.1 response regulator [Geobacillus sp. YHL]UPT59440.1 response regulator [Geobacillus thermoleovorans]